MHFGDSTTAWDLKQEEELLELRADVGDNDGRWDRDVEPAGLAGLNGVVGAPASVADFVGGEDLGRLHSKGVTVGPACIELHDW